MLDRESNLFRVQVWQPVGRRATRVTFQVRLMVTRRRRRMGGGRIRPGGRVRRRLWCGRRVLAVVEVAAVRADGATASARRLRRGEVARLTRKRHGGRSVGHRDQAAGDDDRVNRPCTDN